MPTAEAAFCLAGANVLTRRVVSVEPHLAARGETHMNRWETARDGHALITFLDGSEQELDVSTEVLVRTARTSSTGTLVQVAQAVGVTTNRVTQLGAGSSYQVETPSAVAFVRGTKFIVGVVR